MWSNKSRPHFLNLMVSISESCLQFVQCSSLNSFALSILRYTFGFLPSSRFSSSLMLSQSLSRVGSGLQSQAFIQLLGDVTGRTQVTVPGYRGTRFLVRFQGRPPNSRENWRWILNAAGVEEHEDSWRPAERYTMLAKLEELSSSVRLALTPLDSSDLYFYGLICYKKKLFWISTSEGKTETMITNILCEPAIAWCFKHSFRDSSFYLYWCHNYV